MDGVESALGGGKLQRTPHGPPDRLARDPIPQCLMHGAMVEVRQHVHPSPAVRITGPQMPLQPLPQLCLTHAATVPTSTGLAELVGARWHHGGVGVEGMVNDPLAGFSPPVRRWFSDSFSAPTRAQSAAWEAINGGHHALLVAPTGSGKTLAAFLSALDRLACRPDEEVRRVRAERKTSVLYISPLKALASDVQRNLTAPLRGIEVAARALGRPLPDITVGLRSGDTPSTERRKLVQQPPDILITTPESLFLMLSSRGRETLDQLDAIIVDEIHALAGTKRGAHLQLSLERLDDVKTRSGRPGFQRIGLSATVSPAERVARYLVGNRPIDILQPMPDKQWDLRVETPVPDLTDLALPPGPEGAHSEPNNSIWPHIEKRVLELVDAHRTTLVFVNSRRVAERLTAHLNELHAERLGIPTDDHEPPAMVMAQSGSSGSMDGTGAPVIARAHHGSVSKERRLEIESALKAGHLPCVVATSSLELGIDMGSIDLVVQVAAPNSIASGLQRVGRAGHQVGAVSRGIMLPTHRGDLLDAIVVTREMAAGHIEPVPDLRNPLDILAQQLVSMLVDTTATSEELFQLVRRAESFRTLPRSAFDATLDMLAGRYPSEEFAELRPRLVWDRATDQLSARPGSRRLVTTSGGTIPDRGLFGVFVVGEPGTAGRRVGELDEEMVHESRVGDVFTLGTTSWRIEEITPHQVLVSPAPGAPGRLPFWKGDQAWRPQALGAAVGEFIRELRAEGELSEERLDATLPTGVDEWSRNNLVSHLTEQAEATGEVPDDRMVVVERFTDELGDWRLVVHSALGAAVLTPWALAIEARGRELHGSEVRAWASNDGIVITIPDTTGTPPGLELLDIDAAGIVETVTNETYGSPLFAARFRECAARALLLPRLDPGRRTPLWRQRQRAAQLLQVASRHPEFPIILETMRECLEDVFDLPSLTRLVEDLGARRVRLVLAETDLPSPFARSLMFGYAGEFLYDSDQPLAERRLAALNVDQALLAELLGREGAQVLLDPAALAQVEADLQRLSEPLRASTAEALWDVIRTHGPLTVRECGERSADSTEAGAWVDELLESKRIATVRLAGTDMVCTLEDLPLLTDAFGVPTPPGMVAEPGPGPQAALERLVQRELLHRCGLDPAVLAQRWGISPHSVLQVLDHLRVGLGLLLVDDRWWHPDVLSRVKRRTLALLRAEVEPVEQAQLARFLASWQELDAPGHGTEGLMGAVEMLAGFPLPASMLESLILPSRVVDYSPHLLDQVLLTGEVVWTGAGAIGTQDGWVQLWPGDLVLTDPATAEDVSEELLPVLERLRQGGAWTAAELGASAHQVWELVWAGQVTSTSFQPVRDLVANPGGRTALRTPRAPRVHRRRLPRPTSLASAGMGGRWSVLTAPRLSTTERSLMEMGVTLQRHGLVTRGTVAVEPAWNNFSQAYQVLSTMEGQGAVRRGHVVEGLGASQFALPGAIDRIRSSDSNPDAAPRLLAACDPANPWGAALPWPATPGHRPSRRAGALVVTIDGRPTLYVERGVHTLLTFGSGDSDLLDSLRALAGSVTSGRISAVTVEKCDGIPVLGDARFGPLLEQAGFTMAPRGYRIRR